MKKKKEFTFPEHFGTVLPGRAVAGINASGVLQEVHSENGLHRELDLQAYRSEMCMKYVHVADGKVEDRKFIADHDVIIDSDLE
jgi:hypothetical protein